MKSREYFVLSCKIFGIYCLFVSIGFAALAITTFTTPGQIPNGELSRILFLKNTVTRLIPLVYIVLGIYLISVCL